MSSENLIEGSEPPFFEISVEPEKERAVGEGEAIGRMNAGVIGVIGG